MVSTLSMLLAVLHLQILIVALAKPGHQSANLIYWEEELPAPPTRNLSKSDDRKARDIHQRPLVSSKLTLSSQQARSPVERCTPHKLRTNLWKVKLRITRPETSNLLQNSGPPSGKRQLLWVNFDPSGYCRIQNEQNTTRIVGQWRMIPSGIWWSIPTFGHCTAEVHLHPFGPHPKMLRGVVVSDDTSIRFRPVVATFDAVGVGPDLKDFAHAHRGLGLDKTQTFWK
jgi:hypothetical protein